MVSIKVDAGKVREFKIVGEERTKKMTRRELREAEKRVKDFLERILGGEEDD